MNKNDIYTTLSQQFDPIHLDIIDDSHKHTSHQGTPHTENTHFHVIIVSKHFENQSLVHRHRLINHTLKTAFANQLHALKITAKTPEEWPT